MSPKHDYPDDFEQAWRDYPRHSGASKIAAFKAWNVRLKDGYTPAEMLEGVRKYALYIAATDTQPSYIKLPETFFGPACHFMSDWGLPGKVPGEVGSLLQFYREERLV